MGDPDQLTVSLAIGVPLARARGGRVTPLFVTTGEETPHWLVIPEAMRDVVDQPVVRAHRRPADGILEYVREARPAALLVNWRGEPSRGRYLLGRTLDPVIEYAPCNVLVARVREKPREFAERMARLRRILVPASGGPNAPLAIRLARELAPGADVTALRVAHTHLGAAAVTAQWTILQEVLENVPNRERVEPQVEHSADVVDGILRVARDDYDLVLVGAAGGSLVDRLLFGNVPQELGQKLPLPLIVVRRDDPAGLGLLRRARWRLINTLPQLALDERVAVYHQVRRNARSNTDFYAMMTLASAIVSLGLLLNSPAVIIGGMIMAPTMLPIVGISLGVIQGDAWLLRTALRTTILGVLLSLAVSAAVGVLIPALQATPEMIARSAPSLLDLAVALASGAAAAYAFSRRNVATVLPGVAVAVSLEPPLATVGLAMVLGDGRLATGALLLYLANLVAIVAAAGLLFLWMGFRLEPGRAGDRRTFRGGLLSTTLLLTAITLILTFLSVSSVRNATLRNRIDSTLRSQVASLGDEVALVAWNTGDGTPGVMEVNVSVQSSRDITPQEALDVQRALSSRLGQPVALELTVIPIHRLEPDAPPGG